MFEGRRSRGVRAVRARFARSAHARGHRLAHRDSGTLSSSSTTTLTSLFGTECSDHLGQAAHSEMHAVGIAGQPMTTKKLVGWRIRRLANVPHPDRRSSTGSRIAARLSVTYSAVPPAGTGREDCGCGRGGRCLMSALTHDLHICRSKGVVDGDRIDMIRNHGVRLEGDRSQ
jgi:hypothetical protein